MSENQTWGINLLLKRYHWWEQHHSLSSLQWKHQCRRNPTGRSSPAVAWSFLLSNPEGHKIRSTSITLLQILGVCRLSWFDPSKGHMVTPGSDLVGRLLHQDGGGDSVGTHVPESVLQGWLAALELDHGSLHVLPTDKQHLQQTKDNKSINRPTTDNREQQTTANIFTWYLPELPFHRWRLLTLVSWSASPFLQ